MNQVVNTRPITPVSDTDSVSSVENYETLSGSMLTCVCLANSSLCSKPVSKDNFQVIKKKQFYCKSEGKNATLEKQIFYL